jgi:predicted transcriptional regulator
LPYAKKSIAFKTKKGGRVNMSKQFVRLAADIVIANSTGKGFTTEQLTQMLKEVADTLKGLALETEGMAAAESLSSEAGIPSDWKASVGRNTITCLICGYSGKLLTPHLKSKHKVTPREYRKQFAIPARTPLVSKAYQAKRKKIAKESGLGEKLKKAREAKKAAS